MQQSQAADAALQAGPSQLNGAQDVTQFRCLGEPLCYLKCETGDPNEYVHIWVYENAGDREAKRAKLWSDPEWLAYTKKSAELGALVSQENKLMNPVGFCPLGSKA